MKRAKKKSAYRFRKTWTGKLVLQVQETTEEFCEVTASQEYLKDKEND